MSRLGGEKSRLIPHKGYTIDPEAGLVYGKRGRPIRKLNGTGYLQVTTTGGAHVAMVHRMIWEAANGPIPDELQINHINGRKADNRLINLEVVTGSENCLHAFRTGLSDARGEKNGRAKLTAADVLQIRASCERHNVLALRYGVNSDTIRDVRRMRSWRDVK